jgi:hypothetical protein
LDQVDKVPQRAECPPGQVHEHFRDNVKPFEIFLGGGHLRADGVTDPVPEDRRGVPAVSAVASRRWRGTSGRTSPRRRT